MEALQDGTPCQAASQRHVSIQVTAKRGRFAATHQRWKLVWVCAMRYRSTGTSEGEICKLNVHPFSKIQTLAEMTFDL